ARPRARDLVREPALPRGLDLPLRALRARARARGVERRAAPEVRRVGPRAPGSDGARAATGRALRGGRPRGRFARASALALAALAAWSFLSPDVDLAALASVRRRANLARFLERDALPFPLRAS